MARESKRAFTVSVDGGPLAYLITFPTYGTWLHGDERGSVDENHNIYGTAFVSPNAQFVRQAHRLMSSPKFLLNEHQRRVVHETILETARHREWYVHTLAVRTNHVHVVVSAQEPPERVLNALKSWCTRRMAEKGLVQRGARVWVRHGSTRYLWKMEQLEAASRYVHEGQGENLPGSRNLSRP